jgi:hypothetical protein
MSLLLTASPWKNDEVMKRKTTIRRTQKKYTNEDQDEIHLPDRPTQPIQPSVYENFQDLEPTSIEQSQEINHQRTDKINFLLNQMSSVSPENDGNKLADFKPPPNPENIVKRPIVSGRSSNGELSRSELLPTNPLQPSIQPKYMNLGSQTKGGSYHSDDSDASKYSSYRAIYEPPKNLPKPYYAGMGIGGNGGSKTDDKLMEKINYMIHLLEDQQNEKTNNVTEEFILYSFLGIFMIFIVDSFTKTGKYVR